MLYFERLGTIPENVIGAGVSVEFVCGIMQTSLTSLAKSWFLGVLGSALWRTVFFSVIHGAGKAEGGASLP